MVDQRLTFFKLIRKNEFKALLGIRYSTLFFLVSILYITFLCFGFSKSALKVIHDLSANTLSNWINIPFLSVNKNSLKILEHDLENPIVKKTYNIKDAYFYNKFGFSFLTRTQDSTNPPFNARTINTKSSIISDLLDPKNLVRKNYSDTVRDVFNEFPDGLIVTEKLMDQLGFPQKNALFLALKSKRGDWFPAPVIAVVKELPDLVEVVCSPAFYFSMWNTEFYPPENKYLNIFIQDADTQDVIKVKGAIRKILELTDPGSIECKPPENEFLSGQIWKLKIGDEGGSLSSNQKYKLIASLPEIKKYHFGRYIKGAVDTASAKCPDCFSDYLAIEFYQLDKIRDFANLIKTNYKTPLNMETLVQRENYLFAGNVAMGSIILVLLLSIFSITIYIADTFKNHLNKVKKNLGNFLALGASNNDLIRLYLQVALKILLYGITISFVLANITGEAFEKYFLRKILVLQEGRDYFLLINSWSLLFMIVIVLMTLGGTFFTVKNILKSTPGDLIYERDSKTKKKHKSKGITAVIKKRLQLVHKFIIIY